MTDTIPLLIMYLFYSFQLFGSSPFFSHLDYRPASPPSRRTYVHVVEVCFSITQSKAYLFILLLPGRTAALRVSDLPLTFVVLCDDDYRLLNQLVSDTAEALGKNSKKARITTWFRAEESNLAPPQ